ncbi:MAG: hypothetical protein Q8K92_15115, partial [Leadbetterella sp.]|nr:hypothetical protein [Leadbetterella sp.]
MKLLSVSFCILIGMKPIHAQWTQTALKQGAVVEIIVSEDKLIAGDWGGGVFISYTGGTSWAEVGNWHSEVWSIEMDGSNIFAGTAGSGVYLH